MGNKYIVPVNETSKEESKGSQNVDWITQSSKTTLTEKRSKISKQTKFTDTTGNTTPKPNVQESQDLTNLKMLISEGEKNVKKMKMEVHTLDIELGKRRATEKDSYSILAAVQDQMTDMEQDVRNLKHGMEKFNVSIEKIREEHLHHTDQELISDADQYWRNLKGDMEKFDNNFEKMRKILAREGDSSRIPAAYPEPTSNNGMESSPPTIVIVGGPGTGKSSLGNLLLQKQVFNSLSYKELDETQIKHETNKGIAVFDVPSNVKENDPSMNMMKNRLTSDNVALIFTLKYGHKTEHEDSQIEWIKAQLSEDVIQKRLFVAITNSEKMKNKLEQQASREKNEHENEIQSTIKLLELKAKFKESKEFEKFWKDRAELQNYCQERYFLVNNVNIDDQEQKKTRQSILNLLNLRP